MVKCYWFMFLFSRLLISLAKHGCTKLVNNNKSLTAQFEESFVKIKSTDAMALKTLRALRKKAFYLSKRQRDRLIKEKGPHRSVNFYVKNFLSLRFLLII